MAQISRKEQAVATREKLLDTAKNLFAEMGYHGTPVRAITRQIQKGDGILYHYFPGGKQEIMSVLLRESFEHRVLEIKQLTHEKIEHLPLREALLVIMKKIYELFLDDLDLMRILFRENDLLDLEEAKQLSVMVSERVESIADVLRRRHAKGEIRFMNFTLAARQLLSMWMQYIFSSIIGIKVLPEPDVSAYLEEMVDFTVSLWQPFDGEIIS
ncbi:TetR/AcrR family transcriptional regulator [Paenibacillus sacheonensis]|uniref:TetR family transcriptional regulator n=1 Tax=Paenibacillus sacheonensis TaxID=742054 RepID=A0A7X4YPW2_9BACL|nr:TetR/AcrR family transcriptional regulator [Paenibacillus sacheonensis]MBM7565565.1 AcrR family transcriptional regulator [Paenibacillus sacheonensis]NBC69516.1 TetR family transcriptional regulator [Paenibacillus sacheonensis]